MKKLVITALLFLIAASVGIYFFADDIVEGVRQEQEKEQEQEEQEELIKCKYTSVDTVFNQQKEQVKIEHNIKDDISLTLGQDTVFLSVPFAVDSVQLSIFSDDEYFTKVNQVEATSCILIVFKRKNNVYFATRDYFPMTSEDVVFEFGLIGCHLAVKPDNPEKYKSQYQSFTDNGWINYTLEINEKWKLRNWINNF